MTVATRCPSLLTTNPVTPSLSLILSGAGFIQVTVMEVALRLATARPCGGPVGTGEGWYMHVWIGYSLRFLHCRNSKQVRLTTESRHEYVDCYLAK